MKGFLSSAFFLLLTFSAFAQTNECGTEVGCACKTSKSANVILRDDMTTNLQDGDLITARYGTLCIGQATYTGGSAINITVWGENSLTGDAGIPEGGTIEYTVLRPATNLSDTDITVDYLVGDGIYTTGDIEFVQTFMTSVPLPVELTDFTALADGQDAVLVWQTATETNNAGFTVEHAAPSDTTFTAVAFVEGQGTTAEAHRYRHRVEGLAPGAHRFRLKQVDFDGSFAYSAEVEVEVSLPEAFALGEAYPNPFNPVTRLELSVRETEQVEVSVYDVMGRRVGVLHRGSVKAGQRQELVFDGSRLGSGLYFIRARGETFEATRQVMLVK